MSTYFAILLPILFGVMSGVGVWLCFWWQRIGWTITLSANLAWVLFGLVTGIWGLSIGMVLASTGQAHHLWRTRREPFTGRRIPVPRTKPARTRRMFRHEVPLTYEPGRAPVPVATPAPPVDSTRVDRLPVVEAGRVVGVACPCGCGRFAPSDFVGHLERNRGNLSHWAVANRG